MRYFDLQPKLGAEMRQNMIPKSIPGFVAGFDINIEKPTVVGWGGVCPQTPSHPLGCGQTNLLCPLLVIFLNKTTT